MPKCTAAPQGRNPALTRRTLLCAGAGAALAGRAHTSLAGAQSSPSASRSSTRDPRPKTQATGTRTRFVRHAESQIDLLRTIDLPGRLPPDDGMSYPLTELGMRQAVALGEQLRSETILAVVSSPRLRCTQTADAIAFAAGTAIELAPGTEDIVFGDAHSDPTAAGYLAVMQTMTRWIQGDPDAHTSGGESLTDVLARFLPSVQEIINRFAGQSGDLVFVSHSTVLAAALPFFFTNLSLGWTLTTMLPAAGVATGEFIDGGWRCTDWNGMTPG